MQGEPIRFERHEDIDLALTLEAQLPEPETTLAQITKTTWNLRQELTGGLTETLVNHAHQIELTR